MLELVKEELNNGTKVNFPKGLGDVGSDIKPVMNSIASLVVNSHAARLQRESTFLDRADRDRGFGL